MIYTTSPIRNVDARLKQKKGNIPLKHSATSTVCSHSRCVCPLIKLSNMSLSHHLLFMHPYTAQYSPKQIFGE